MRKAGVGPLLAAVRQPDTGLMPACARRRRIVAWHRAGPSVTALGAVAVIAGGAVPPGLAVGHSPRADHGAAARLGRTAYVTDALVNEVTPVNMATNRPGKPIKVGSSPLAVAVVPGGKTAYVADYNGNTVTPIVTATNTPGALIKVGNNPWWIAVTPDGKTAYVVNWGSGTVTPILTATNRPGAPIKVGKSPTGIAFAP